VVFTHRSLPDLVVPAPLQIITVWVIVLLVLLTPRFRRRVFGGFGLRMYRTFWEGKRRIFTLWGVGYLAFLVIYRTFILIDPIGSRLAAPGVVPLVVPLVAFLADAFQVGERRLVRLGVVFAVGGLGLAGLSVAQHPLPTRIQKSERLSWIMQETSPRDLVVGDALMAITNAEPARNAALIYPSTYTEFHLTYEQVVELARRFDADIDRVFVTCSNPREGMERRSIYGPFIDDLVEGRLQDYPGITAVATFEDGYAFLLNPPPAR
jgi:hypothetical protein